MDEVKRTECFPQIKAFFAGGVGDEVTGSSTVLKILRSDGSITYGMIDAGAVQGKNEYMNFEYPINGQMIDFVVITHAHYDHVGALPLLYKQGFKGKIYSSKMTKQLAYPILCDAAKINERKCGLDVNTKNILRKVNNRLHEERLLASNYQDKKNLDSAVSLCDVSEYDPLYTQEDVENLMELFNPIVHYDKVEICKGISVRLLPTTHQNGACLIELYVEDNGKTYNIAFTGDIGPKNSLLYEYKDCYYNPDIDCLLLESLHGLEKPVSYEESTKELYKIIKRGIKQKKHIVLAGYSLERNAQLIYLMRRLRASGVYVDVVVDSPLTMLELMQYQSSTI